MAVVLEVDSHKAGLVLVFHKKIPYSMGIGERLHDLFAVSSGKSLLSKKLILE